MKKFEGFINVYSAITVTFGVVLFGLMLFYFFSGNALNKEQLKLKKQQQSMVENRKFYNRQPMQSAYYRNNFPVQAVSQDKKTISLNAMLKQNIASSGYVQTSGSSGVIKEEQKKEISEIMNEYALQVNQEITASAPWFNNSTPERSIAVYNKFKTDMDNFITATNYTSNAYLNAPEKSRLLVNVSLLNMTLYFNTPDQNNKTALQTLAEDFEAYQRAIPEGEYKTFINEKIQSLISFSNGLRYSIDPALYQEKLGHAPDGTLAQDQMLVNKILADINSMSEAEKLTYADKISVLPSSS